MKNNFYIYKKTSEDAEDIAKFLISNNVDSKDCHLFVDTNRDFIHYEEMKDYMQEEKGILIINSLHSIAYSKQKALEELEWFSSNKIQVVIVDMPSTWVFSDPSLNLQSISTLIDFFRILQQYPNFDFQNPEFVEGGRKKIRFPSNWESNYKLYASKEISANEFQKRVGLKRATFFNLLSEYKQLQKLNQIDYESFDFYNQSFEQIN